MKDRQNYMLDLNQLMVSPADTVFTRCQIVKTYGTSLVSTANQLVVIAKKRSVEQPIEIYAL